MQKSCSCSKTGQGAPGDSGSSPANDRHTNLTTNVPVRFQYFSSFRSPSTQAMFLSVLRAIAVLAAVALASVHASPAASNETSILEGRQGLAQVITSCTVPDTAALTFDDGPYSYIIVRVSNYRSFLTLSHPLFFFNQEIATQLQAAGGKGTFFFNGKNCSDSHAPALLSPDRHSIRGMHLLCDQFQEAQICVPPRTSGELSCSVTCTGLRS